VVAERFDPDLTRGGFLDLWSASARALRAAGVAEVERLDLCTRCDPDRFFSHRRQGPIRGAQGVVGLLA
jgi:copper oxidase (laccase) domain-containing protein